MNQMPWGWVGLAFACARFAGNGLFETPSDMNGASLCSVPGRGVRAYVFIGFAGEGATLRLFWGTGAEEF